MLNEIVTAPFSQGFQNFLTGKVPGLLNAFHKPEGKGEALGKGQDLITNEEQANAGGKNQQQVQNLQVLTLDVNKQEVSKNSQPTARTAANTNYANQSQLRIEIDKMFPIQQIEGLYNPLLYEKQRDVEKLQHKVKYLKKELYNHHREIKNWSTNTTAMKEENLNLRK